MYIYIHIYISIYISYIQVCLDGVKDEHGREPLDIPGASTSALITLSILCDSDPVQAGRTLEAMLVPVCM